MRKNILVTLIFCSIVLCVFAITQLALLQLWAFSLQISIYTLLIAGSAAVGYAMVDDIITDVVFLRKKVPGFHSELPHTISTLVLIYVLFGFIIWLKHELWIIGIPFIIGNVAACLFRPKLLTKEGDKI